MNNIQYSIDKKEKISKDDEISVFKLYNLHINSGSKNNIILRGLYYPIKYNIHYSHLLIDYLGPFLQMKEKYPNLKMIFLKNKNLNIFYSTEKVCNDLAKEFNAEIVDISENNYILEEVILHYRYDTGVYAKPNANWPIPAIPKTVFAQDSDETEEDDLNIKTLKWLQHSAKCLNKYFSKYVSEDIIEKLYISRKTSNKIHTSRMNNDPDMSYHIKYMLGRRVHDEKYDTELENKLKDRGYIIIDPSEMGFFEQIKYCMLAKNIVSIDGGGMLNILFNNKNCFVFQIKVHQDYEYFYKNIIEAVNNNKVYEIDVRDMTVDSAIDYIIKSIP